LLEAEYNGPVLFYDGEAEPVPMPGRLLIFCGIPGSGKTTIAREVVKTEPHAILIQTDDFRRMVSRPSFSAGESNLVYQSCAEVAKVWLDDGRLVILDGTFGSRRRREGMVAALEGHCSRADFVHVVCDLKTALGRNSARDSVVPPDRVNGMLAAFEAPLSALVIDSSKVTPHEAAQTIARELLRGPVREPE